MSENVTNEVPSTQAANPAAPGPEAPGLDATPRRSLGRRLLRGLLVVTLGVLLIAGGLDLFSRFALSRALDRYESGSLDFADFVPKALPEDVANGSDYEEAAMLLTHGQSGTYVPRQGKGDDGLRELWTLFRERNLDRNPLTDDELDTMRGHVERLDVVLRILDEGLEKTDRAQYKTDWSAAPFEIVVPNLLARMHLSALLRARGEIAAAEGRWEDAWRDAAKIQRFSNWTVQSMPILINFLIYRVMAYNGLVFTQHLLAGPDVDESFYEAVAAEVRRTEIQDHFAQLMDGERAAAYNSLLSPEVTSFGSVMDPDLPLNMAVRRYAAASYLDWAGPYLDQCKHPSHSVVQHKKPGGLAGMLVELVSVDCEDLAYKRDFAIVSQAQLVIALELEAHRRAHGAYPASLGELDGNVARAQLEDPFVADGILHYAVQEDGGYRLWSVSANGTDEGGLLPPAPGSNQLNKTNWWRTGDLVWWVRGG